MKHRQTALDELKAKLRRGARQAYRGEFASVDEILRKITTLKRRRAANNR